MATWEDIEERTISGTGSIRIPAGEDNQFRAYRLYLQLIRPPSNRYRNYKYPQFKEYLGKALFYKDLYVCDERELNFTAEKWEFVPDYSSQNLIAIKCLYDALVSLSSSLGTSLSASLNPVENLIKNYTYLEPRFDRIVFKLYNNTALKLLLQGLKHDTCDPINDKQQPPNNPPPPDRNPPPSNDPVDVSPGYDGDDDNGFYEPYSGDPEITPPELPGNQCQAYRIVIRLFSEGFGGDTPGIYEASFDRYGEISISFNDSTNPRIAYINHFGSVPGECLLDSVQELIIISPADITGYDIVSFEEI